MNRPTNLQRLQYILDLLAEPFPTSAKEASCGCGDTAAVKTNAIPTDSMVAAPLVIPKTMDHQSLRKSVRELIEEALAATNIQTAVTGKHLHEVLLTMSETTLGQFLQRMNTAEIDLQLQDLALFMDPQRTTTTFKEIVEWDRKRTNRPLIK